jgi:class 3 adenylate cyclase
VSWWASGFFGEKSSCEKDTVNSLWLGCRLNPGTFPHWLSVAHSAIGDALETVEQALNFNPEEVVGRPETLRIRGELRLKQGDRQLAEADFRDSIAMARSMGAKAWELRTTMSLARLLDGDGHRSEARTMLAEIYNWFTEGFDTADLKDAKVLRVERLVAHRGGICPVPKCGTESPAGKRFCVECASPLPIRCPQCGAESPANAKFCADCGSALTDIAQRLANRPPIESSAAPEIRVTLEQAETLRTLEGERKTVTALFADIKGSTELMRDLDPEEARAIIDPVLQLMMDAVHRYDGYVVQSAGDGIFALFDVPVAHEDHPQRALHAVMAMRDGLHRLTGDQPGWPGMEVRIGINTGEAVLRLVHTGGHTEYTPVGHAANLAARMQSVAPAGAIVVSEETMRLVDCYFEVRGLGPTEVKGFGEPLNIYEVIGSGPLHGRFDLAVRRGLTKFVGREREIADINRALELALSGHGQIVAVVAEAGTGKSRLFYELKATVPAECKVLEAYSVSHGKASAWLPVLELMHGYFGIQQTDDPATPSQTHCPRPGTFRHAALLVLIARYRGKSRPAGPDGSAAKAQTHIGRAQADGAEREHQAVGCHHLRGPALDRRSNSGISRPAGRQPSHCPHPAVGQQPPRIPP